MYLAHTWKTSTALPYKLVPLVRHIPFTFKQPAIVASPVLQILFDVIVLVSNELVIFTSAAFKVPTLRQLLIFPLVTDTQSPLMLPPIKEP